MVDRRNVVGRGNDRRDVGVRGNMVDRRNVGKRRNMVGRRDVEGRRNVVASNLSELLENDGKAVWTFDVAILYHIVPCCAILCCYGMPSQPFKV